MAKSWNKWGPWSLVYAQYAYDPNSTRFWTKTACYWDHTAPTGIVLPGRNISFSAIPFLPDSRSSTRIVLPGRNGIVAVCEGRTRPTKSFPGGFGAAVCEGTVDLLLNPMLVVVSSW